MFSPICVVIVIRFAGNTIISIVMYPIIYLLISFCKQNFILYSGKMGSSNGKYKLTTEDLHHLSMYSGRSEDDIKRRFEIFCIKYPKGKIPKEEYTALLKNCYRQTNSAQLETHISRAYDMDGDGWIDFKEFLTVLYIFGGGTPQEKLTQVFRIFDYHDDGYLRKEEVQKIVRDMFHLLGKISKYTSGIGYLFKSSF